MLSMAGSLANPKPMHVYRYGPALCACLAIPKIAHDLYTLGFTNFEDKEEDDEMKDPTLLASMNAGIRAVKESHETWKVVTQHCPHLALDGEQVVPFLDEMDAFFVDGADDAHSDDESSNEDVEDDDCADFNFFKQWEGTVRNYQQSLFKILAAKADDPEKEKHIREKLKALVWLFESFENEFRLQRNRLALESFQVASRAFERAGANEDASVRASLLDEKNRKLTKLREVYPRSTNSTLFCWTFVEPFSIADPETNHIELWYGSWGHVWGSMFGAEEEFKEYKQKVVEDYTPVKREGLMAFARVQSVAFAALDKRMEKVVGTAQKERFFKLLRFLSMIVGTNYERGMIVFAWVIGAAKAVVDTTSSNYSTSLLVQSITAMIEPNGSAKAGSRLARRHLSAPKFAHVMASIVIMQFAGSLLGDILRKVQDAGQNSIRKALSTRLTAHVLSQDLDDIIDASDNGRGSNGADPVALINSLSDNAGWQAGLGSVLNIPQTIIQQVASLVSTGALLWDKSPTLSGFLMVIILANRRLAGYMHRMQSWVVKKLELDKNNFDGQIAMWDLEEALESFEDMRINAKETQIVKDAVKTQNKLEQETNRSNIIPSFLGPVHSFISGIPNMASAYLGGRLALGGQLAAADLASFSYQVGTMLQTIESLQSQLYGLWELKDRRFRIGFDMIDLLDRKPKIGLDDGWQPAPLNEVSPAQKAAAAAVAAEGGEKAEEQGGEGMDGSSPQVLAPADRRLGSDIVFDNVKFRYKGTQKALLRGASFSVKAGTFVGICGERAVGKSTLFRLLLRLYDVSDGEIRIGGHPISYYNPVWLRSQIGLAKQDPAIYTRTLRENVVYGAEETLKKLGGQAAMDKHLEVVLRQASIWHHFNNREKFPQGLDTYIHAFADTLTGGEKRSIANARALLRVTPILLLDEPTAGLDAQNEQKVTHNMIHNRPEGQTVLVIAHRLSTLRAADQIIFMEGDGTIKESGTWDELCTKKGKFWQYVQIQNLQSTQQDVVLDRVVDREEKKKAMTAENAAVEELVAAVEAEAEAEKAAGERVAGTDVETDTTKGSLSISPSGSASDLQAHIASAPSGESLATGPSSPHWKKIRSSIRTVSAFKRAVAAPVFAESAGPDQVSLLHVASCAAAEIETLNAMRRRVRLAEHMPDELAAAFTQVSAQLVDFYRTQARHSLREESQRLHETRAKPGLLRRANTLDEVTPRQPLPRFARSVSSTGSVASVDLIDGSAEPQAGSPIPRLSSPGTAARSTTV